MADHSDLDELLFRIAPDTDRGFAIWNEGGDLHYGWFGMSPADAVTYLRNTIADIEKGHSANLGPAPTRH